MTMLILLLLLVHAVATTITQSTGLGGTPENITVRFIDSRTVQITWSTVWNNIERFEVTYKQTESSVKVVYPVAGNSKFTILQNLQPDTQYQWSVTALVGGKKFKSRTVVFRTAPEPQPALPELPSIKEEFSPTPTKPTVAAKGPTTTEGINPDPTAVNSKYTPLTSTTVRGVELGLVLLALVVWIVAIVLFFHRWGKIRMLLPYQPDYKTQQSLKVPGTGSTMVSSCTGTVGGRGQPEGVGCVQHLRWSSRYDEPSTASKSTRKQRLSSAIFPTSTASYVKASGECHSPEVLRHAYSHTTFRGDRNSSESIPLCTFAHEADHPDQIITIVDEKPECGARRHSKGFHDEFERSTKTKTNRLRHSVDSLGDSLHNFINCVPLYGRRTHRDSKHRDESHDPLFFVNDTPHNMIKDFPGPSLSPEETEMYQKLLPQETKPSRYKRTSLKKQKTSLYEEKEAESCQQVPIFEINTIEQQEVENTPKCKRKTLTPAEMKRKTFLRKISLQETYLNYNQDYWLDFEKSARFHRSIDLGFFGTQQDVVTSEPEGPRKLLSDIISEKSVETVDSIKVKKRNQSEPSTEQTQQKAITRQSEMPLLSKKHYSRGNSEPTIRIKKCSCNKCGTKVERLKGESKTLTELIADLQRNSTTARNSFADQSIDDIPLFRDRNGHIEFDFLNELLDEECCLLTPKNTSLDLLINEPVDVEQPAIKRRFDDSEFCEIKLTDEIDAMQTKTFDFRGGHAFFGETKTSTSEESDVFMNDFEYERGPGRRREISVPIVSISSPSRSNSPEEI